MDRIDMQGTNGIRARLAAQGAAPIARSEPVKPAADNGAQARPVDVKTVGLAGAQPPIDEARVSEIRKAVEQGRYPLLPYRVADGLIAAGFILRKSK